MTRHKNLADAQAFGYFVSRMMTAYRHALRCRATNNPNGASYLVDCYNLGWVAALLAAGVKGKEYADN
jgi:hypothetical protein